jgi:hypothetical protein
MPAIQIGQTNSAGTTNTSLETNSTGPAFSTIQRGTGSALRGDSTSGPGGYFSTTNAGHFGVHAVEDATSVGAGAALRAEGKRNNGVHATSDQNGRDAVLAVHNGGGVAIEAYSAGVAVYAQTSGSGKRAVLAASASGLAVAGWSSSGIGVIGQSGTGHGVEGWSSSNDGVFGFTWGPRYAGYFQGNVMVIGDLTKGSGTFRIDHPLDPENKYLQHSFVESPDRMNVYNGNTVTDRDGLATIELPAWFGALNRDFRYQLTTIGSFSELMVKSEIANNRFEIQSAKPRVKVSWQVTGIRKDAYAKKHPLVVELDKPEEERGLYAHPAEHGKPASRGIGYARIKEHEAMAKADAKWRKEADTVARGWRR